MKIEHIAIWAKDIEGLKNFYCKYFNGKSSELYVNEGKGFQSYFISFGDGARLEIMNSKKSQDRQSGDTIIGLAHFAIGFKTMFDVMEKTKTLKEDGFKILSEPRTTGDGYFESVVLDPEGNHLEIVKLK